MTFLTILIATTIELVVASCEAIRSDRWITDLSRWLTGVCGRWGWWNGPLGVVLTIAAPAAMVGLLFNWLTEGPVVILVAAGVCLLLLTLGPRDLNREVGSYLAEYSRGGAVVSTEPEMSFLGSAEGRSNEPDRAVLGAISVAAHDRVFAPLFWFAVLGPVGPVIYRMTAVLHEQEAELESFSASVRRLYEVLIWLPVRLFVCGLGLAGTLTPTLDLWREQEDLSLRSSETLLRTSAVAAVNYGRLERVIGDDPHVYWVNLMHALVKRTFTLWLVLLAIVTLVAL